MIFNALENIFRILKLVVLQHGKPDSMNLIRYFKIISGFSEH